MNKISFALISGMALFLSACSSNPPNETNSSSSDNAAMAADSTYAPVETNKPNTDYKPAFAGQTRIAGVKTTTAYEGKMLADGLKSPWGIVTLPDGRFLITEKGGTMRIASNTGTLSAAITGLPAVNSGGQGGLLGVTIDPSFNTNRMVYWAFS